MEQERLSHPAVREYINGICGNFSGCWLLWNRVVVREEYGLSSAQMGHWFCGMIRLTPTNIHFLWVTSGVRLWIGGKVVEPYVAGRAEL